MFKDKRQKNKGPFMKQAADETSKPIGTSLRDNLYYLRRQFGSSFDLIIHEMNVGQNKGAVIVCEGMIDQIALSEIAVKPIVKARNLPGNADEQFVFLRQNVFSAVDSKTIYNFSDLLSFIMSGFAAVLIDGSCQCEVIGVQGYDRRSVQDSSNEVQERGAHEGFTETLKINSTLIRRRLKTPQARFEMLTIGKTSKTQIAICYLADRVKPEILTEVRDRLEKANLDLVLESGFLQPFLDTKGLSFFSGVGVTERPDVFCAKIGEGRVGILVDGTPFALIVPYLFIENFHSFDDYANRPYYAVFIRTLKFISFVISILLPGMYVAVACFHQELLPADMLYDVVTAEARTPFPVMLEALVIHFIYEVMREAGLRMPKNVGHAVSIVGALVIGDAAVTAGLIAAPMLIIVALTAISSFVVPSLYEPVAVLRFIFIIIGGVSGFYGILLAVGLLLVNICSINPYGIPFSAPISPFEKSAIRDVLFREGWKSLGKRQMNIQKLNGSEKGDMYP